MVGGVVTKSGEAPAPFVTSQQATCLGSRAQAAHVETQIVGRIVELCARLSTGTVWY